MKMNATMEELVGKYGNSAIKRAKKIGERLKANIALLYCTRGFGELEVSVQYFSL